MEEVLQLLYEMKQDFSARFDRIELNATVLKSEVDQIKQAQTNSPIDYSDTPIRITRNPRRETILFDNNLAGAPMFGLSDVAIQNNSFEKELSPNNFQTTVVQEFKVPEESMMKFRSAKSFKFAVDNFRMAKAQNISLNKRLVHFIHPSVLKPAVDNDIALQVANYSLLNYWTVYTLPDIEVQKMIARLIRPKSQRSYVAAMQAALTTFSPVKDTYALGVRGWDANMHSPICKLLSEASEFDTLFRLAATAEELAALPKLEYGKKDQPGAFRIIMACFGENFCQPISAFIGEERLRAAKTMDEFVKAVRDVNDELFAAARTIDKLEARFKPPEKLLADIYEKPRTPAGPPARPFVGAMSNIDESFYEHRIDLPDVSLDSSSDTLTMFTKPADQQLTISTAQTSDPDSERLPAADELFLDEDVNHEFQLSYMAPGSQPKLGTAVNTTKKVQACFSMMKTGKCDAGEKCLYSHNKAVIEKYLDGKDQEIAEMRKVSKTRGV